LIQSRGPKGKKDGETTHLRLSALAATIEPLAQSMGPNAEIVLHDYRRPEHSVVAVAGSVTQREIGSAMSEIGFCPRTKTLAIA
jgi:predicted transcriptional regulator YheO